MLCFGCCLLPSRPTARVKVSGVAPQDCGQDYQGSRDESHRSLRSPIVFGNPVQFCRRPCNKFNKTTVGVTRDIALCVCLYMYMSGSSMSLCLPLFVGRSLNLSVCLWLVALCLCLSVSRSLCYLCLSLFMFLSNFLSSYLPSTPTSSFPLNSCLFLPDFPPVLTLNFLLKNIKVPTPVLLWLRSN